MKNLTRESLKLHQTTEIYAKLNMDLTDFLNGFEQNIMDNKRHIFLRNLQDYQNNQVYIYIYKHLDRYSGTEDAKYITLEHLDTHSEVSDATDGGSSIASRSSTWSVFYRDTDHGPPSKNCPGTLGNKTKEKRKMW